MFLRKTSLQVSKTLRKLPELTVFIATYNDGILRYDEGTSVADPDPLVRDTDPDPAQDPSIIKQ